MTTETILTDERLIEIAANELQEHFDRLPNSIFLFARAIEQAVLQSPEIQALKDALRELISIVEIHSNATENNFAWAELDEAKSAIAAQGQGGSDDT